MPPDLPPDEEEEDYASSEDSDFAPDEAAEREQSEASEDDEEGGNATEKSAAAGAPPKRKRGAGDDNDAEDAGFENSGDEAVIEKGKKRRKKGRSAAAREDDDEGGEGGLIKTRSMRAAAKEEKKARVVSGPVTVDVDALWAQMTAGPAVPSTTAEQEAADGQATADGEVASKDSSDTGHERRDGETDKDKQPTEMIKIKRTYNFAGKVHTEEKMVARDSAEAKLYLASLGENADPEADDDGSQKRMPKRAFRSAFEPIIDQMNQRSDLNLGMTVRLKAREMAKEAKKLNVVEKSKMDWAGFVDKEGIKDELALAGKSKDSYTARQDFLARSEARREEDARRARLAGKV